MEGFMVKDEGTAAGDWTYLVVCGRMGVATAAEAEKEIGKGLEKSKRLALDLSQVDYISSAGLRVLLRLAKAVKAQGKELCLVQVHSFVKEVLEGSGMEVFFRFVDQVEDLSMKAHRTSSRKKGL